MSHPGHPWPPRSGNPAEATFAAVGHAHPHQLVMARGLIQAGARCRWVWDADPRCAQDLAEALPGSTVARSLDEVLDDPSLSLVCGVVPPAERAALGLRVLASGKDYLAAKPGLITREELAQVRLAVQQTGRRYLVFFSERFQSPATARAEDLVRQGAIGTVHHLVGLGPHRLGGPRPSWFYDRQRSGGIINDLGSHQIDQFLVFTASTTAHCVSARVQVRPEPGTGHAFQHLGEAHLVAPTGASGYFRVDWHSPAGLPTWGDSRTFLTGSAGSIEIRRTIDPGRGGAQVILVDQRGVVQEACASLPPHPFLRDLVADLVQGTATALDQEHVLRVMDLCLDAQAQADEIASAR